LHIGSVKHRAFDVIPLLPVTEEQVIQLSMLSTQTSRFDQVPVESRPDATVFGESLSFLCLLAGAAGA
jgi:hypothetical protein